VEAADGGGCAADGSERVAVEDEAKDGRDGAGGGDNDGEGDGGVRRRGWRSRGLLLVLVEGALNGAAAYAERAGDLAEGLAGVDEVRAWRTG
jgi:hypothetical protein